MLKLKKMQVLYVLLLVALVSEILFFFWMTQHFNRL